MSIVVQAIQLGGLEYQGPRARGYCSDVCRKRNAADKDKRRGAICKPLLPRECVHCHKLFVSEYGNKKRCFCSDECLSEWNKLHSLASLNTPDARRMYSKLRKQRLKNGTGKVDPARIFDRDNWTCQICLIPVNRKQKVPDHQAPTIDHKVPLMLGGPHSEHNVQCAHYICNVRKAGKLPAILTPSPLKSLQPNFS